MFGLPATPPTNLVQQLFGAEALVNPGDGNAGRRKLVVLGTTPDLRAKGNLIVVVEKQRQR
jgi:hypothetical protein